MLNCTDLACVLHHHHFYAHLHHLKHHLHDDPDNSALDMKTNETDPPWNNHDIRALEDESNVETDDNTKATIKDPDSRSDVVYMVCGVVIAMVLVAVIIILVAVTINKLRKRDENSSNGGGGVIDSPVAIEAQQHCQTGNGNGNVNELQNRSSAGDLYNIQNKTRIQQQQYQTQNNVQTTPETTTTLTTELHISEANNNNNNVGKVCVDGEHVTFTRTSGMGMVPGSDWTFPPKAPVPNIYCINPDMLVAANDRNGFKGFRKQFSGRFKRLVARKPDVVAPVIPPELKPQLKTIYVY